MMEKVRRGRKFVVEHLDRALTLLDELEKMMSELEDGLDFRIMRSVMLAHVAMIRGRVARARFLAAKEF